MRIISRFSRKKPKISLDKVTPHGYNKEDDFGGARNLDHMAA